MSGKRRDAGRHSPAKITTIVGDSDADILQVLSDVIHSADFTARSFGHVKESREVRGCCTFKTLGDVVHQRYGGSLNLVAKSKVSAGRSGVAKISIDVNDQLSRLLPNPKLLECLGAVRHFVTQFDATILREFGDLFSLSHSCTLKLFHSGLKSPPQPFGPRLSGSCRSRSSSRCRRASCGRARRSSLPAARPAGLGCRCCRRRPAARSQSCRTS